MSPWLSPPTPSGVNCGGPRSRRPASHRGALAAVPAPHPRNGGRGDTGGCLPPEGETDEGACFLPLSDFRRSADGSRWRSTDEPPLAAGTAVASRRGMLYNLVARLLDRRLALRDWLEYRALWLAIVTAVPGLSALVLMPDHLHAMHTRDVRLELACALAGFARWRNARLGLGGPLWEPLPAAEALVDEQKRRRSLRYVHLNPTRAGLVTDPLAWPFSTHRDAVGLALAPVRDRIRDPHRFHRRLEEPHLRTFRGVGAHRPAGAHGPARGRRPRRAGDRGPAVPGPRRPASAPARHPRAMKR